MGLGACTDVMMGCCITGRVDDPVPLNNFPKDSDLLGLWIRPGGLPVGRFCIGDGGGLIGSFGTISSHGWQGVPMGGFAPCCTYIQV